MRADDGQLYSTLRYLDIGWVDTRLVSRRKVWKLFRKVQTHIRRHHLRKDDALHVALYGW